MTPAINISTISNKPGHKTRMYFILSTHKIVGPLFLFMNYRA